MQVLWKSAGLSRKQSVAVHERESRRNFMVGHILVGLAAVGAIALLSLLAGLLRSAKASSQVTEDQHDGSLPAEEEKVEEQQIPKNPTRLRTAS
jgi:hypothetical protein